MATGRCAAPALPYIEKFPSAFPLSTPTVLPIWWTPQTSPPSVPTYLPEAADGYLAKSSGIFPIHWRLLYG